MKEDDQYSSYITISLLQVSDVTEDYKLLVLEKPTLYRAMMIHDGDWIQLITFLIQSLNSDILV